MECRRWHVKLCDGWRGTQTKSEARFLGRPLLLLEHALGLPHALSFSVAFPIVPCCRTLGSLGSGNSH